MRSDRPDWTETVWFSFNVPPRALAGWLYVQMRPNIGRVAGGAFVYDPSGTQAWEIPYFAYSHYDRMPEPIDLRDVAFTIWNSRELLRRFLGCQAYAFSSHRHTTTRPAVPRELCCCTVKRLRSTALRSGIDRGVGGPSCLAAGPGTGSVTPLEPPRIPTRLSSSPRPTRAPRSRMSNT